MKKILKEKTHIKKQEINRLYKLFFLPKNTDKTNRLKNILTHMFG